MYRCAWLVVAEQVLIDRNSNQGSLINCIDQVRADALPSRLGRASLISSWRRGEARTRDGLTLRAWLQGPDGDRISLGEHRLDPPLDWHRVTMPLAGMPLRSAGVHTLGIDLLADGAWQEAGRTLLEVGVEATEAR